MLLSSPQHCSSPPIPYPVNLCHSHWSPYALVIVIHFYLTYYMKSFIKYYNLDFPHASCHSLPSTSTLAPYQILTVGHLKFSSSVLKLSITLLHRTSQRSPLLIHLKAPFNTPGHDDHRLQHCQSLPVSGASLSKNIHKICVSVVIVS